MAITTSVESTVRPAGWSTVTGGLGITALGLVAAVRPDAAASVWFVLTGAAILLVTAGVLGLRQAVAELATARKALACTSVTMTLFGLAHFYAVVDQDTAIPLFSAFMVLSAIGMIVAGITIVRAGIWSGVRRSLPLICGIWPVLTIPTGAALGDLPHFLAIAGYGICWVGLGRVLLGTGVRHP